MVPFRQGYHQGELQLSFCIKAFTCIFWFMRFGCSMDVSNDVQQKFCVVSLWLMLLPVMKQWLVTFATHTCQVQCHVHVYFTFMDDLAQIGLTCAYILLTVPSS